MAAILNLLGLFYYDKMIGIFLMIFLAVVLNWNFRLQNSELKF